MNPPAIDRLLEQIAARLSESQQRLSRAEREVLALALQDIPPAKMQGHLKGVSAAAIRKRLGELYSKFEIKGQGPGKFEQLMQELRSLQPRSQSSAIVIPDQRHAAQLDPHLDFLTNPEVLNLRTHSNPSEDHQEAAETSANGDAFKGRKKEIETLAGWILNQTDEKQCQVVAIWGIAGIGKTFLLAKFLWEFKDKTLFSSGNSETEFCGVSGVCLSNGMMPLQCVKILLGQLNGTARRIEKQEGSHANKLDINSDETNNGKDELEAEINNLISVLKAERHLIVLDGYEGVLGTMQPSKYADEYKGYDDLLLRIVTAQHKSCLLLTSREKPRSLGVDQALNVKILPLQGLEPEDARQLLENKEIPKEKLDADEQAMDKLINLYHGNPLWLKVAATTINEFFDGNVTQFLSTGKLIYDEQKSALKPQFSRLSLAENEVISWLAINRQPVSFETLQSDIFDGQHKADLVYILRALERRSLLETDEHHPGLYGLQPVVLEFATNRLINRIADELIPLRQEGASEPAGESSEEITEQSRERRIERRTERRTEPREEDCFNRYGLVKADAEEHLQQSQRKFILRPLYEKLLSRVESPEDLQRILQERLHQRRQSHPNQSGYFGGNLLNLWAELHQANELFTPEPAPQDFSALPIWQASFQAPFTDLKPERFSFESCAIERASFIENLGDVFALAFNLPQPGEDGPTRLAAGDSNGRLHLWQLPEMKKRMDWQGHQSWVRSLVFGPHGRWLATGGDDNYLRLWDLQSDLLSQPQPLVVYERECEDWVRAIALAPSQNILAFSSGSDIFLHRLEQRSRLTTVTPWLQLTHLHQRPNEQLVRQPHICVRALAFSPDGRWLASGGDDNRIDIWDFRQLRAAYPFDAAAAAQASHGSPSEALPYEILPKHQGWVRSLCFSPQGDRLISSSDDGTVQIWNIVESHPESSQSPYQFQAPPSLKDHFERVRCTAISADGRVLASGGDDCQLHLWDLDQAKPLSLERSIPPTQGRIWSIALGQRQDELILAYGDDAQTIHLQALKPSKAIAPTEPKSASPALPCRFDHRSLRTLRGYTSSIRTARFVSNLADPSGLPWIISGGDNHKLQLWEFPQGFLQTSTLPSAPATVDASSLAASPRPLLELIGHQGRIWQTAYHGESQILASASDDKTIRLWNLATQDCLQVLVDHSYWVRTVAFDRSGLTLASAGDDETICLWDVRSGVCLHRLGQRRAQGAKPSQAQAIAGHHHWIRTVAFSPDGEILASGGDGRRVLLWNWAAEPAESPRDLGLQAHRIRMVAFSADGQWLASGNDNGEVWLWRYPELQREIGQPPGSGNGGGVGAQPAVKWRHDRWGVKAIAFSPCDRWLATVGDDQTIYIWDLAGEIAPQQQPQKLRLPLHLGNSRGFQSVAFSPDGRYLVTGDREAWIELWQLYDPSAPEQFKPQYLGRMTPPRPYEGMNITHVTGIDALQRAGLKALGAIEHSPLASLGRR